MKITDKNKPLLVNLLIWLAAFSVPALIELLPVSHPPRIYPLIFFIFRLSLAVLSTYLIYSALNPPAGESQDAGEA